MITVEPPVVHPSLGEIALITGIADVGYKPGYKAKKKCKFPMILWDHKCEINGFIYDN